MTLSQRQAIAAAVAALEIHAGACGHTRTAPECPYCDDQRIVREARAALKAAR